MNYETKVFEQLTTVPEAVWYPLFELLQQQQLTIEQWKPEDAAEIYAQLEHPNWAPWLEAGQQTIAERPMTFPEGQLLIKDCGVMVASLSMNQIQWDGNIAALPTWDEVAGQASTNYSETYQPNGNTLVMMSMNVAPEAKGKQLPTKMFDYVKLLSQQLGIEHMMGSFRPSGYGAAKQHALQAGVDLPFWDYATSTQEGTDKPVDPWLRSLWWNGMQMLKEDDKAMKVTVPLAEFQQYQQTFKPDKWIEVSPGVWECEEVGTWTVQGDEATYKESNVWGKIYAK